MILCGYGRPFLFSIKKDDSTNEYLIYITLNQTINLSWLKDVSVRSVVNMLKSKSLLENYGISFVNVSGPLNLYTIWRQNGHRLLPSQTDYPPPNLVMLPTDSLRLARQEAAEAHDEQRLLKNGEQLLVARDYVDDLFLNVSNAPFYISLLDFQAGRYLAAFPRGERIWWLHCLIKQDETNLAQDIWKAALLWFSRIVPVVEASWQKLLKGNINVVANLNKLCLRKIWKIFMVSLTQRRFSCQVQTLKNYI